MDRQERKSRIRDAIALLLAVGISVAFSINGHYVTGIIVATVAAIAIRSLLSMIAGRRRKTATNRERERQMRLAGYDEGQSRAQLARLAALYGKPDNVIFASSWRDCVAAFGAARRLYIMGRDLPMEAVLGYSVERYAARDVADVGAKRRKPASGIRPAYKVNVTIDDLSSPVITLDFGEDAGSMKTLTALLTAVIHGNGRAD